MPLSMVPVSHQGQCTNISRGHRRRAPFARVAAVEDRRAFGRVATLSLDPWSDRVTGMDVARAVLSVCSGVT